MIDVEKEEIVSLRELGKRIERSYNNVLNLVAEGRYSIGGKKIVLETIKTPSGMKTSMEAYYRFLRSLNEC